MFITLDGSDGTGKTTVAELLCAGLRAQGHIAVPTAEPTDSALGREIRAHLRAGDVSAQVMTDLFIADRAEHVRDFILPQTEQGNVVVCDRYRYSTVCYQHLQGQALDVLIERNRAFPTPTLSVILTVPDVRCLLERIGSRGQARDIFEREDSLVRISQLYLRMSEFYPEDRFLYVDASRPPQESADAILEALASINRKT